MNDTMPDFIQFLRNRNRNLRMKKLKQLKQECLMVLPNSEINLRRSLFPLYRMAKMNFQLDAVKAIVDRSQYLVNSDIVRQIQDLFVYIETNQLPCHLLDIYMSSIIAVNCPYIQSVRYAENQLHLMTTVGSLHVYRAIDYLKQYQFSNFSYYMDGSCFQRAADGVYHQGLEFMMGITDGRFQDEFYVHCFNYDPKRNYVIDHMIQLAMPLEQYQKVMQTQCSDMMSVSTSFLQPERVLQTFVEEKQLFFQKKKLFV